MRYFARECRGPRNQDSRNRNQDSSKRTVNVEETSSKAMLAIDGAGFDWSYMFNKFEFNLATYKRRLASIEEQLVFYEKKFIKRKFSVARTPQQNGVAERRNRTLIEAARTINDESQPSSDAGKKNDEGVYNATLEATHADLFGDETEVDMSNITTAYPVPSTSNTRIHKDHSLDHVIGDVQSGVQTKKMTKTTNEQGFISDVYEGKTHEDLHTCLFVCFLSQVEPKKVNRNKKDKRGIVLRNKARLVAQGYTQEEGIDYDEVFAPVARIKAIRLFLAYALFMNFVVYQMDMKSAFLYGKIEEEFYVCQPPGFEDPEFPDRVYK
ncbi:putative ribonuclease H-like domain-containing protein, partial [Tanacetum coccineum]